MTAHASSRVAAQIAVPTLILHALDDPFVRMLPATRDALLANRRVRLIETAHGGHCAFLAPAVGYDGYWAEKMLLDFLLSVTALMEADWSVALGGRRPGDHRSLGRVRRRHRKCRFVDLRLRPHSIDEIEEARARPGVALGTAAAERRRIASLDRQVRCVDQQRRRGRCAVRSLRDGRRAEETAFGAGCYIDLLPRDAAATVQLRTPGTMDARSGRRGLRATPARAARVELVLRAAEVEGTHGFWRDLVRRGLRRDRATGRAALGRGARSRSGRVDGGPPSSIGAG